MYDIPSLDGKRVEASLKSVRYNMTGVNRLGFDENLRFPRYTLFFLGYYEIFIH